MAYVASESTDHKYWANVEDLDDIAVWREFEGKKNTKGMIAGILVPSEVVPRRYVVTVRRCRFMGSLLAATASPSMIASSLQSKLSSPVCIGSIRSKSQ